MTPCLNTLSKTVTWEIIHTSRFLAKEYILA